MSGGKGRKIQRVDERQSRNETPSRRSIGLAAAMNSQLEPTGGVRTSPRHIPNLDRPSARDSQLANGCVTQNGVSRGEGQIGCYRNIPISQIVTPENPALSRVSAV